MKENFLILDNVVSESYLKQFIDNIFDYNWRFSSNLTHGDYTNSLDFEYGFSACLTENQVHFILPLIFDICDLSNIKITNKNQVSRIVPRLQTMLSPINQINDIHVDSRENHYVIIFYPHNIDGETILYNETTSNLSYSKFNKMSPFEKKEYTKKFTILEKIQPKENRALVFNGNRYHASSSPSKGPRCIININVNFESQYIKSLNYQ